MQRAAKELGRPCLFLREKSAEVGCTETLSALTAGGVSDQIIVLGDGSAARMGKGLTGICSLHRKRVPIRKIGGKHADLTGGNSEESEGK